MRKNEKNFHRLSLFLVHTKSILKLMYVCVCVFVSNDTETNLTEVSIRQVNSTLTHQMRIHGQSNKMKRKKMCISVLDTTIYFV